MRLGVLDVGSNTVRLLVVDAHHGAHPWPAASEKATLRLAEQIGLAGRLPGRARGRWDRAVATSRTFRSLARLSGGQLDGCPSALREGVILRRLDQLEPA
jgi:exopolyphosphatase/pppGpp-phosphohydrolase